MTAEAERQAQLLRGSLDMCLLALLDDAPTHAYDLVVRLAERGLPGVGYGTIYPLVGRLRRLACSRRACRPVRRALRAGSSRSRPPGARRWPTGCASGSPTTSAVQELLHASGAVPDREEQRT